MNNNNKMPYGHTSMPTGNPNPIVGTSGLPNAGQYHIYPPQQPLYLTGNQLQSTNQYQNQMNAPSFYTYPPSHGTSHIGYANAPGNMQYANRQIAPPMNVPGHGHQGAAHHINPQVAMGHSQSTSSHMQILGHSNAGMMSQHNGHVNQLQGTHHPSTMLPAHQATMVSHHSSNNISNSGKPSHMHVTPNGTTQNPTANPANTGFGVSIPNLPVRHLVSDAERLDKLVKHLQKKGNVELKVTPSSIDYIINYSKELATIVMEQAAMVAKHRKSDTIEASDIQCVCSRLESDSRDAVALLFHERMSHQMMSDGSQDVSPGTYNE